MRIKITQQDWFNGIKINVFLWCIFWSVGCSHTFIKRYKKQVVLYNSTKMEKQVIKYVKRFEFICNVVVDVPISFEKLEKPTVGVCRGFRSSYHWHKNIGIDLDYWVDHDEFEREALVFHELAHCILNRDHDNTELEWRPKSLLNKWVLSTYIYSAYREQYLEELCPQKKPINKSFVTKLLF